MKKLKLKKFYEKIYEHIKKNIKGKKISNEKYNRWLWIMVVKDGEKKKERKKKEKSGDVASGKWDVWESWCERNKKNKWFMCLWIVSIKVKCILSFTFEGNCETNLKVLLKYMNR